MIRYLINFIRGVNRSTWLPFKKWFLPALWGMGLIDVTRCYDKVTMQLPIEGQVVHFTWTQKVYLYLWNLKPFLFIQWVIESISHYFNVTVMVAFWITIVVTLWIFVLLIRHFLKAWIRPKSLQPKDEQEKAQSVINELNIFKKLEELYRSISKQSKLNYSLWFIVGLVLGRAYCWENVTACAKLDVVFGLFAVLFLFG